MSTISDLLAHKGKTVCSIGTQASVLEAARLMNDHKIGCLVVTEGPGVAGIFTERDVLRRVVAEQRNPAATTVGQVMTREVVCAHPETSLDEARSLFKNRRIRHLPVVDAHGELAGLVSIGDLNAHQATDQEITIHYLTEYLHGRA